MNIKINNIDSKSLCVDLCGRIDTAASAAFEQSLQPVFADADKNIELNCAELNYISSSGLRLFLALLKRVQASKGSLRITHLSEEIHEVFRMTGFSKIFIIEG